jgi:CDGSH-type Zn-finger protein/uncharacterized Fe-S cluster protein YjdI
MTEAAPPPSREQLIHHLYEAAELEHNLMCTYLYAAFSLRQGEGEGLSPVEAPIVERWRRTLIEIAVEEMGHLTAVWNITAALGGAPRFGRGNFPLDPGALPAGIVVKLTPFNPATVQHFVYLERPEGSDEAEGHGFMPDFVFVRPPHHLRLMPVALDYQTVGTFYAALGSGLSAFVDHHGEAVAFAGNPALQLSSSEVAMAGRPVICSKTALAAFTKIVEQGEGAPLHSEHSHYQRFAQIRDEFAQLLQENPAFSPSFPAATNPVLRPPLRAEGRVWLETPEAMNTVDLANTCYQVMLRLLAYSYTVPRPRRAKTLAVDLSLALMRATTWLGEHAARLPAGPSNPDCNAGMSFTALRDASPFLTGPSAGRFFVERLSEIAAVADDLAKTGSERPVRAARLLRDLLRRAERGFEAVDHEEAELALGPPTNRAGTPRESASLSPNGGAPSSSPERRVEGGVEYVEAQRLTLHYEGKRCIHARHCVTGGPTVFLANVQGPWIHPDTVPVEAVVELAHACPSGAIRYAGKDGLPDETAPPVNLISIREAGPYGVRAEIRIDGAPAYYRATLCRCGASKNKPYCDSSHKEVNFSASGEPPTGSATDMLPVRNGPLDIELETDGPLNVRGNLEITAGTGRVVARVTSTRLCRCGGSSNKPFCDGTHARIGFRST